jgi:hypothetical protein
MRASRAEARRVLDEASDVREVLLTFAGAASGIEGCPDLALQQVLDVCDRQPLTEHVVLVERSRNARYRESS